MLLRFLLHEYLIMTSNDEIYTFRVIRLLVIKPVEGSMTSMFVLFRLSGEMIGFPWSQENQRQSLGSGSTTMFTVLQRLWHGWRRGTGCPWRGVVPGRSKQGSSQYHAHIGVWEPLPRPSEPKKAELTRKDMDSRVLVSHLVWLLSTTQLPQGPQDRLGCSVRSTLALPGPGSEELARP
jgi:hypothetical protein